MRFGSVAVADAAGAVLAHTQRLADRVLRKGTVLDAAALDALRAAGVAQVVAARLEPGDVHENAAAARLAAALAAPGLAATQAGTGRVNLLAAAPGLFRVDPVLLDALNAVCESLTAATLADATAVAAGDMVATLKVIPFAAPEAALAEVEALAAAGPPALALLPFRPLRVGLVLTTLPGLKASVLEGTVEATAARVAGLTGTLLPPLTCAHATGPIAAALRALLADGAELLLVAGASAVVDRGDVGPAGIVAAGGAILRFGMPVDPGNLICLGRIGGVPALVLPGCARSPALNGIDWVLRRLFAGVEVDSAAIGRMGVGGLLKEASARPLPRARAPRAERAVASTRRVAAVVLAAGRSSRMALQHKLLVEDGAGRAMVARVVDHALASGARPVLVVTGHRASEVAAALAGRDVVLVAAPDYADGLSASLRAGLAAVPEGCAGALVCLGDMPLVTGAMLDRLTEAYDPEAGASIVVPTHRGKPGNPVLWDRRYFAEIAALTGDGGARPLLARHTDAVAEVELGTDAVLRDFDTVESLAALPDDA